MLRKIPTWNVLHIHKFPTTETGPGHHALVVWLMPFTSSNWPLHFCSNMSAQMDGNEVRGDLLFQLYFKVRSCVRGDRKKSSATLSAFPRDCIVKCIAALLQVSNSRAKHIWRVCAASVETFATGMTLWLSSGKVQLVVFSCSFGALCLFRYTFTAH